MPLVVLLGGARSGKSQLALELAEAAEGRPAYLATAEGRDAEMRARIASHRAERGERWDTLEEPLELARAVARLPAQRTLVADCLSLWVANLLERGDSPESVLEAAREAARGAATRTGLTVAVTNEVGLGIVPATPLGRAYRDLLGSVNRAWVDVAAEAAFVVAGRALLLVAAETLTSSLVGGRAAPR
jgi:adenosyl cobinamide kinase/adenosyl cobinamide phosphate guanylyltransferase